MSYSELVAELQTLKDDELDTRWHEAIAQSHTAHATCMAQGGHVEGEFHYHSPDSEFAEACSASTSVMNLVFYEYERRSFKTPHQRDRDAA